MTEETVPKNKPSEPPDLKKHDMKPDGSSGSSRQSGTGSFPGITVEQLDEMLEERQGGDRRKTDRAVDFPDRRVNNRRKDDKSEHKTK